MKRKILVIHSSLQLAQDIAEFLQFNGYDTLNTSDPLQGIKYIYEFQPELVISAIRMLGADGYEVLEKLRRDPLTASTLLIFLQSVPDDAYTWVRAAMNAGADDFIYLPFAATQLLEAVQARFKRKAEILGMPIDETVPLRRIKHHLFLSYSREDISTMLRLKEDLRRDHLTVWSDENLTPGTPDWTRSIEDAIESSGGVVAILSPSAKKSEWVKRELTYARLYDIPIFPVLARGDQRDAIPMDLINVSYG